MNISHLIKLIYQTTVGISLVLQGVVFDELLAIYQKAQILHIWIKILYVTTSSKKAE